jgi:molybdopterin-binding protein
MLTLPAPTRLTARERARRAARGGASRSAPAPLLVPALIAVAFLVLPLVGLLVRAPWGNLGAALSGTDATQALVLSLWTATLSTAISLVIGVPLAWVLARTRFPGQRLVRALVTLPLVLPPVVGGVALLLAFGRTGLVGRLLDSWFGLTIPFTPIAVVMAETFVAMPFLIIRVEGALRSADQGFEEIGGSGLRGSGGPAQADGPRRPQARRTVRRAGATGGIMQLSARNQIPGRVTSITIGEAIANVHVDANGAQLVASITVEALRQLGLTEGSNVTAVIKASDVILATGD